MLYSELVLTGHTLGLAMQLLSQVLEEYPEMQTPYTAFKQQYAPGGGTVQMLFRVGTPNKNHPADHAARCAKPALGQWLNTVPQKVPYPFAKI